MKKKETTMAVSVTPSSKGNVTSQKTCSNCGAVIPDKAKECPECKGNLKEDEREGYMYCTKCGEETLHLLSGSGKNGVCYDCGEANYKEHREDPIENLITKVVDQGSVENPKTEYIDPSKGIAPGSGYLTLGVEKESDIDPLILILEDYTSEYTITPDGNEFSVHTDLSAKSLKADRLLKDIEKAGLEVYDISY